LISRYPSLRSDTRGIHGKQLTLSGFSARSLAFLMTSFSFCKTGGFEIGSNGISHLRQPSWRLGTEGADALRGFEIAALVLQLARHIKGNYMLNSLYTGSEGYTNFATGIS
jgi:hypothetical protein